MRSNTASKSHKDTTTTRDGRPSSPPVAEGVHSPEKTNSTSPWCAVHGLRIVGKYLNYAWPGMSKNSLNFSCSLHFQFFFSPSSEAVQRSMAELTHTCTTSGLVLAAKV